MGLRRIAIRAQVDAERDLTATALRDVDGLVMPPSALLAGIAATLVRLINAAGKPAVYAETDFVARMMSVINALNKIRAAIRTAHQAVG